MIPPAPTEAVELFDVREGPFVSATQVFSNDVRQRSAEAGYAVFRREFESEIAGERAASMS